MSPLIIDVKIMQRYGTLIRPKRLLSESFTALTLSLLNVCALFIGSIVAGYGALLNTVFVHAYTFVSYILATELNHA